MRVREHPATKPTRGDTYDKPVLRCTLARWLVAHAGKARQPLAEKVSAPAPE